MKHPGFWQSGGIFFLQLPHVIRQDLLSDAATKSLKTQLDQQTLPIILCPDTNRVKLMDDVQYL